MKYRKCFLSILLGSISVVCIHFSFFILSTHYYQSVMHISSSDKTSTIHSKLTGNKTDLRVNKTKLQSADLHTNKSRIVSKWRLENSTKLQTAVLDKNMSSIVSKWLLKNSTEPLLTIPNLGRMGNWMFQYASLLGIAQMNHMRPFVTRSNKLLNYFNISFVEEHNVKKGNWSKVQEKCYAIYDKKMERLPKKNTYGVTYFQSWKYFHALEGLVRKELTFKSNIQKDARLKFERYIKNRTHPIIAMHIRRTDMLKNSETRRGYVAAPKSYLEKAMKYMTSKFGNVTFLVATDDVTWSRNNFKRNDVIVIDKGDAAVDMATLALCDHMIMSVGTYGWWTAWLVNGHTVYFKDFPASGRSLSTCFVKEDHFLPHWIPLGS